jgi:ribosomal protein L7/L12
MSISSEAKQEVARLLTAGQKNEAISYLEDTFQISLIDAKTLVEVVEKELNISESSANAGEAPNHLPDSEMMEAETETNTLAQPAAPTELWGPLKLQVEALIIAGKKIEAVKLVRVQFRKGLKEALEMVEEVQRGIDPSLIPPASRSGCAGNTFRIVAILFGIVSFLLLAGAGLAYWATQDDISKSDRIKGRVVEMNQTRDGTYTPVIVYDWNGKSLRYTSTMSSNPPEYTVSEEVYIYVERENPENVMIDSFSDRWLGIVIIGGLGLFFAFFSGLLAFAARRF